MRELCTLLRAEVFVWRCYMPDSEILVHVQRVVLIVFSETDVRPNWMIPLIFQRGNLVGFCVGGAKIVAISNSRELYSSMIQAENIYRCHRPNGQKGTIWMAVVNGIRSISMPDGEMTPLDGVCPELIRLYSTTDRPLLRRERS